MKFIKNAFFALATGVLLSHALTAGAAEKAIVIGSTFDAAGPTKETMKGVSEGANIYLQQLNARGGVNGKTVQIIEMDDAFKPDVASGNAREHLMAELSPLSRGLITVQATPWPWGNDTLPQREFRAAMKQAGKDQYDYYTYEGYMNAQMLTEVLRAGATPTRESFIKAARALKLDLGGEHVISFRNGNAGSTYTEITLLSGEGRFIH